MNKELEEAIKILETFKVRQKTINYNKISLEDVEAIETALNYIDNSISKEAIKEKIEELKNRKMHIVTSPIYSRDEKLSILKRNQIKREILQELVEGK